MTHWRNELDPNRTTWKIRGWKQRQRWDGRARINNLRNLTTIPGADYRHPLGSISAQPNQRSCVAQKKSKTMGKYDDKKNIQVQARTPRPTHGHKRHFNLWEPPLSQEGDVTTKFLGVPNVQTALLTPSAEPLCHLKATHEIPSIWRSISPTYSKHSPY